MIDQPFPCAGLVCTLAVDVYADLATYGAFYIRPAIQHPPNKFIPPRGVMGISLLFCGIPSDMGYVDMPRRSPLYRVVARKLREEQMGQRWRNLIPPNQPPRHRPQLIRIIAEYPPKPRRPEIQPEDINRLHKAVAGDEVNTVPARQALKEHFHVLSNGLLWFIQDAVYIQQENLTSICQLCVPCLLRMIVCVPFGRPVHRVPVPSRAWDG